MPFIKRLRPLTARYSGLLHSVDILPTILRLAGHPAVTSLDGVDQWDAMKSGGTGKSPRDWLVYNIDDVFVPNFLAGPRPQQQKFQVLNKSRTPVWAGLVSDFFLFRLA